MLPSLMKFVITCAYNTQQPLSQLSPSHRRWVGNLGLILVSWNFKIRGIDESHEAKANLQRARPLSELALAVEERLKLYLSIHHRSGFLKLGGRLDRESMIIISSAARRDATHEKPDSQRSVLWYCIEVAHRRPRVSHQLVRWWPFLFASRPPIRTWTTSRPDILPLFLVTTKPRRQKRKIHRSC